LFVLKHYSFLNSGEAAEGRMLVVQHVFIREEFCRKIAVLILKKLLKEFVKKHESHLEF
jgi:hypothetical protein